MSGERLAAIPGVWPDTAGQLSYQWKRCDTSGEECTPVASGYRRTYSLKGEDVDHTMRVSISDGSASSDTALSDPTEVVVDEVPSAKSFPVIYGEATQGRTLNIIAGEWDPGTAAISHEWRRCSQEGTECTPIEGATSQAYSVQAADIDSTLRVAETATTSGGSVTRVSEPTDVVQGARVSNSTPPTITESGSENGGQLTGHDGNWSGEGELSFRREWLRCDHEGAECVPIDGEKAVVYSPTNADVGHALRFLVEGSGGAATATANSAPTSVIEAVEPQVASVPTIIGRARAGEILEGIGGGWLGLSPISRDLQWLRCDSSGEECEQIEDATNPELELTEEEIGSTIRLHVTATNEAGSMVAPSAATEVVAGFAGPPPGLVSSPSISGEAQVGEELTGEAGVWSGAVEYEYQWSRCGASGQGCQMIPDVSGTSYSPSDDDAGSILQFEVRALAEDESIGYASATTDQTVRVAGGPESLEAPALEGVATEGEALSVDPGSWAGSEPITFSYSWETCEPEECIDIEGATESDYTLSSAEVFKTVQAVVTAHNPIGETTAVSAATLPVDSLVPVNEVAPSATGGDRVSESLTADPGIWNGAEPVEFSFQWQRCDSAGSACAPIENETGTSYEMSGPDVGGSLRVLVTATNEHGEGKASSSPTMPISDTSGPSKVSPPVVSGESESVATLTTSHGSWEGAESYAYQWQRCAPESEGGTCANIPNATSDTYAANSADIGAMLRTAVTATGTGGTAVALSTETDVIRPSLPSENPDALTNITRPSIDGVAEEMETFSVDLGRWISQSPISFEYRWRRCNAAGKQCAEIEGASSSTYVLQGGDIGGTVRVMVVADNGSRRSIVTSDSSAVVTNAMPRNIVLPSIEAEGGEPIGGALLMGEPGTWHGDDLTFDYQWQRCNEGGESCEAIGGATQDSYLAEPVDVGTTVRVKVTASNELGSTDAFSTPTEVIGPPILPAINGANPSITGQPFAGREIEAGPGSWTGEPPIEYAYQWQRCSSEGSECEDIEAAADEIFLTTEAEIGLKVRVKVTASNGNGSTDALSLASEPIANTAVANVVSPSIEGGNRSGVELEASVGEWSGSGPIEYAYQWRRCDAGGEDCENIEGETDSAYIASPSDIKNTLRVAVTATGPLGEEATESAALTILPVLSENLNPPTISGDPKVGETLTANPGEWSPVPEQFAYKWQKCSSGACIGLSGSNSSHTLKASSAGYKIRVRVTAESDGDTDPPSAYSATTEPVAEGDEDPELPPVNEVLPSIEGTPEVDEVLDADPGEWSSDPPVSFDYLWKRCDQQGKQCELASAADGSEEEHRVGRTDAGGTMRLQVTASNEGGSTTAISSPTITVPAAPPIANVRSSFRVGGERPRLITPFSA